MEKEKMADKFSSDLDAYVNGIKKTDDSQSEEYNELLELGKILADKDFSKNSNKEDVFNKTFKNIRGGKNIMKKPWKTKNLVTKVASLALVCVLCISLTQTSFAQEIVNKVVKTISLGHITVFQEEPASKDGNLPEVSLPAEQEKIYIDENTKIHTVAGEEIADLNFETGEVITVAEEEKMMEELTLVVKDSSKLNNYTCFDVLLPSYLPEGYKFNKAEFLKGNKNDIVENSKYISLYFTNEETGKYIYMQQRFADEETAFATSSDKVEELKINGVKAVFYGGNNLNWEANGVLYILSGRGEITKDELIKMAESIK